MAQIVIVSAGLGAGHDGAAQEIARRLRACGHHVTCHDFLDLLPLRLGRWLRSAYRRQLDVAPGSWEWLLTALARRRALAAITVWLAAGACRALRRVVGPATDGVICTYPLAGQAAARLRRHGRLAAPVVTYLTDPSVHPLWIAEGTDLYLAAHPDIADQARACGAGRVTVVAPAVRPTFRPVSGQAERARARAGFGLPAEGTLALVASGSWAVGDIERSARDVADGGQAIPVVVCGENAALRARLADLAPGIVFGWVTDMPGLMRACDLVVLTSGGLTFFEAHATGLPVLTYRCLAGHGRTNARSLDQAGLARWVHDPAELAGTLAELSTQDSPAPLIEPSGGCPSVAIEGLLGRSTATPARQGRALRRRVAVVVAALAWLSWLATGGSGFAVAHGFRAIDSAQDPLSSEVSSVWAELGGLPW